jgi:hypothetical protein
MKILKKVIPKIHLKLSPFFNKCISFFDKKNVTVTKKYILFNLIFSPPIVILLFNIICFSKIFVIYKATIKPISFEINMCVLISVISFILGAAIYGLFAYRKKSLFISFVGSSFIKILSVLASFVVISLALQPFNFMIFIFVILINLVAIMIVFTNNRKFTEHVHDFKSIDKFKLIFTDVDNFDRIVTFINNMNVFYHSNHVVINGYNLSYQDVSVFEDQFDKKLYDFNQDELNVVTMYSIK